MAWRLDKMSNRNDAKEAISWFEHQFQNHHPYSPERCHLRKLKHYFTQIEHVNNGLISDTENMHFSLGEVVRKLKQDMS
jgi:hypothetical protein